MELMQLEMFVAVVEEGSVHAAAERVFRTQPAVSMAIRKLEDRIGSPLFDRTKRHDYLLTPAGEVLYSYATRLLNLRNEAVAAIESLIKLRQGQLRIGANESTNSYLLPQLTQVFHQRYPNIKIEAVCQHTNGLIRQLKERRLDLALLAHLPEGHELEAQPLLRDEVVLITSPRHHLAARERVHVRELGKESVIVESQPSSVSEKVVEAFSSFETTLNIRVESATIDMIKKMVAKNAGVGFVPLMCVREEIARRELVSLPVEGFQQKRTLWAVRRREGPRSHAAEAFMQVVKLEMENFRGEQPAILLVTGSDLRKRGI
ncbi:MAG: LysR family transcriptional regulator [Pyrinomonadaceae bacterium]|nr:LysR family transcriptional regulator [Pyrinomonadaceae bacterium]